jgi:HSP20 family protein
MRVQKEYLPMAKTEVTKGSDTSVSRPRDFFSAMRDEMDRVFDQFERGFPRWPSAWRRGGGEGAMMSPELDVRENGDAITIEAELPGVDEKDISVTVANGLLTIKGEKRQEKEERNENYYLAERSYGTFQRSLRLPESIDDSKVEAKFDKGVLKITAAKKPEAVKAERRIEVKKA